MTTTLGPIERVVASIHDDGLVLFETVNGGLYASNRTGARIWQALERGLPADVIAADLADRYQIAYDTAAAHTQKFLAELERQRLVQRR
jgi:hypothetical protein